MFPSLPGWLQPAVLLLGCFEGGKRELKKKKIRTRCEITAGKDKRGTSGLRTRYKQSQRLHERLFCIFKSGGMCVFAPVSRHGGLTVKFTFHSEVSVAGFTEDTGMFLSNSVVRSSVFGYALRKAPSECNLALQHKLNDHIFPEEKGCAIVPYQQSCCKPFYESKPRIMVLPTDNSSITYFFYYFFLYGSRSEMLSVKTSF